MDVNGLFNCLGCFNINYVKKIDVSKPFCFLHRIIIMFK